MLIIDSRNFMLNRVVSGCYYLNYAIGSLGIHLAGFELKPLFDSLVDRVVDYYLLGNLVKRDLESLRG